MVGIVPTNTVSVPFVPLADSKPTHIGVTYETETVSKKVFVRRSR